MDYKAQIASKDKQIQQQSQEIFVLKAQLNELRRIVFGAKSERFVSSSEGLPNQLNLFNPIPEAAQARAGGHTSSPPPAKG